MSNAPKILDDVIASIKAGTISEHLNRNVELKASWNEGHGHKISAFSNKLDLDRAWLIIGVDDSGQLMGKNDSWAQATEQQISSHINQKLDPIQACKGIHVCTVDESIVILVELQNPGDIVYWGENAYGASGTTIVKLLPEQILELRLKLPGLSDFSRQTVTSKYDVKLLDLFAKKVKEAGHFHEQENSYFIFDKLGLRETQAARILFGDCSFRVVQFDTDGEPLNNTKIFGLYTLLTTDFQNSIQHWPSTQSTKTTKGVSVLAYPKKALQEALANAVAHAAYFEQGGDLIIEVHPNYLVISNLCIRESNYFANRWFSRAHKTVNPYLMEILRVAKHVDELGRGKNLIFSESITHGKKPPIVRLQGAGRYFRWALTLNGNNTDKRQMKVFKGIQEHYGKTTKALIAQALVLWSSKQVKDIKNYVDDTFSDLFAEVLLDLDGPIFYNVAEDKIVLHRWVRVMLEEGKDAKQLTPVEEKNELAFLRKYCIEHEGSFITPKLLRRLIHLGENPSAKSYASRLLAKWADEGHLFRNRPGLYHFTPNGMSASINVRDLIKQILSSTEFADVVDK